MQAAGGAAVAVSHESRRRLAGDGIAVGALDCRELAAGPARVGGGDTGRRQDVRCCQCAMFNNAVHSGARHLSTLRVEEQGW